MREIDIIIPVYNAFDDLRTCVDSVFRHTDLTVHHIIFVNDHSPDERIAPYLDSLAGEHVQVIHNAQNYGFSHNVNIGFSMSDHDVLLLNTDTIVTERWLEKIQKCAYSSADIGTVTPFTNLAEFCAVQIRDDDGDLFDKSQANKHNALIEKCSLFNYPEIPGEICFCAYIKREVINTVGEFIEESLVSDYGVKSDFCNRVQLAGYRHVLCDDTFVCRRKTERNAIEIKRKSKQVDSEILKNVYPRLEGEKETFIRKAPLDILKKNVNLWRNLDTGKRSILYIVHRDFKEGATENVGGTQFHVRDLKNIFCDEYNIFVLARDKESLILTVYAGQRQFDFCFYVGPVTVRNRFTDPAMRKVYEKVLDTFRIDIIHVHHLFELSHDIFDLAQERHIPIYMTTHDYYMVCPRIKLLDYEEKVCAGCIDKRRCVDCLASGQWLTERVPKNIDYIGRWRDEFSRILSMCERLIAPSESAKEIFSMYYPNVKEKISVIEHGQELMKTSVQKTWYQTDKEFKVAFVGGMNREKGSGIAVKMIRSEKKRIHWYVMGGIGDRDLFELEQRNLTKTGWYKQNEIVGLIKNHEIDLVCIPAIWPETFCYVLSEALSSGVPVLAADIGALGERVRKNGCGWIVSKEADAAEYMEKLQYIIDNADEYQRVKRLAEQQTLRSLEEMKSEYQSIYRIEYPSAHYGASDKEFILLGALGVKNSSDSEEIGLSLRLAEKESELQEIYNSLGYKGLTVLRRLKIPFRKQIKATIRYLWRLAKKVRRLQKRIGE